MIVYVRPGLAMLLSCRILKHSDAFHANTFQKRYLIPKISSHRYESVYYNESKIDIFNKSRNKSILMMIKEEQQESYKTGSSPKVKKRTGGNDTKKRKQTRKSNSNTSSSNTVETWRIFGIEVHPDAITFDKSFLTMDNENLQNNSSSSVVHKMYLDNAVMEALCYRLKLTLPTSSSDLLHSNVQTPKELKDVRVVRRSLDARKKRRQIRNPNSSIQEDDTELKITPTTDNTNQDNIGPRYTYVLDIDVSPTTAKSLRWKHQPGRLERLGSDDINNNTLNMASDSSNKNDISKPKVIIIGAGPAGLFCALTLAQSCKCTPIILERGQPVESRGKDIGALIHRRTLNSESNFAFGEGGAGTWSDGKLTTRIGRNSSIVRQVLETFVKYGAPEKILIDGSPHLGTDNLVRLLRNMRLDLRRLGGDIHFGAKMTDLLIDTNGNDKFVKGVEVQYSDSFERGIDDQSKSGVSIKQEGEMGHIYGDAIVLATGHSARDVYEKLHQSGVQLEPKGFAAGFRIEHPQKIINKMQYGNEWGPNAYSGKKTTDDINKSYFTSTETASDVRVHEGKLPVSSYRLATDKAFDGERYRGAYSFCMCPGGQIVPASTDPNEICVNGMSFSRRDSVWANAALVVTINADDPILDKYREKHGVLAGIEFQRDMERRASQMGGGNFTVPVQRLTDFMKLEASTSAPSSSYRLGVKPAACHQIFPNEMVKSLQDAVLNHFEKQMPGFLCDDALLHGVEMRTSSPVRVCRDRNTFQAIGVSNLFPAGEGAGFAGGIVSAAVDGIVVAQSILRSLSLVDVDEESQKLSSRQSVGFDY